MTVSGPDSARPSHLSSSSPIRFGASRNWYSSWSRVISFLFRIESHATMKPVSSRQRASVLQRGLDVVDRAVLGLWPTETSAERSTKILHTPIVRANVKVVVFWDPHVPSSERRNAAEDSSAFHGADGLSGRVADQVPPAPEPACTAVSDELRESGSAEMPAEFLCGVHPGRDRVHARHCRRRIRPNPTAARKWTLCGGLETCPQSHLRVQPSPLSGSSAPTRPTAAERS